MRAPLEKPRVATCYGAWRRLISMRSRFKPREGTFGLNQRIKIVITQIKGIQRLFPTQ
jgi:hypothetical protein